METKANMKKEKMSKTLVELTEENPLKTKCTSQNLIQVQLYVSLGTLPQILNLKPKASKKI